MSLPIVDLNLRQPFIKTWRGMPIPAGWRVTWKIGRREQSFFARSPGDAVKSVAGWLKNNNLEVDEDWIWLQANIQWLARTSSTRHTIPLEDLQKIALHWDRSEDSPEEPTTYKVAEYSPRIWDYWHLMTARQTFDAPHFKMVIEEDISCLDPKNEPYLGCVDCYTHAVVHMKKTEAEFQNIITRDQAAKWVTDFHNSVNEQNNKPAWSQTTSDARHFRI